MRRVLTIGAHPDDIEFGCGATTARFVEEGFEVLAATFSNCDESLPFGFNQGALVEESKNALTSLGILEDNLYYFNFPVRNFPKHRQEILQTLLDNFKSLNPDLVIFPSPQDLHQDHSVLGLEVIRAFKKSNLWSYILPWNNFNEKPNHFVEINENHVGKKISALGFYESQAYRFYSDSSRIKSILVSNGLEIEVDYAELFHTVRQISFKFDS